MTVYVDNAAMRFKGGLRYHMTATTIEELHAFANRIGFARCWYDGKSKGHPHYDITETQRTQALWAGAIAVTSRELARHARLCR